MRQLVYSRTNPSAEKFDGRQLGLNKLGQTSVYTGDRRIKIFGRTLLPDLDTAKKRMVVINGKMIAYKPSQAWFNYAAKFQPKPTSLTKMSF